MTDIAQQLERRRRAVAAEWNLGREVVLVGAGEPVPVPGRGDLTYPFRSHSEYLYLTDRERAGGVLAFDPDEGWVDFVVPVTREEMLWEGARPEDAEGVPIGGLPDWLERRRDRPVTCLGAPSAGVAADEALGAELRRGLNRIRRQKDAVELERMRAAERATRAGFARLAALVEPGRTERELQIEIEAEFFRNHAERTAYDSIVAGGPNAAVLHFPPTARKLEPGELLLVDAGAEHRGYASDVTRTYPVGDDFSGAQAELYELVHSAQQTAIARCTPGTEYRDIHWTAARVIAEGLVNLGILRGSVDDLVERRTVSLFFPHGVGHMVGLGVRDAGEVLPGREARNDDFPRLRIDLPLLHGHVVTIEPGVYFVPALLHDPELRARHRDAVDWERAERMLGFGGIRLEENVLVTDDGPDVLTADIPHAQRPHAVAD
jgi:Xaa-Pro aminopeptidase